MTNGKMPKNAEIYSCENCNFKCSKKSNYHKHILTAKHQIRTNTNGKMPKNPKAKSEYKCVCNKVFKHASSLWNHKQKCGLIKQENETIINQDDDSIINQTDTSVICKENQEDDIGYKEMFLEMVKENRELHKTIHDMIPKIGNNNTINNTTTNNSNSNNQFNIQLFLNEDCKNALNITDFVRSLEVNMSDFINTGKLGYVDGISRIFVKALKDMDVTERPIHCTDIKRETVYIKDDNKWEKEDEDKSKMKKTIRNIENKNLKMLPKWQEENPEHADMESHKSDEFMKMSINALGGNNDKEVSEKKIMKNVLKEVILKKEKPEKNNK